MNESSFLIMATHLVSCLFIIETKTNKKAEDLFLCFPPVYVGPGVVFATNPTGPPSRRRAGKPIIPC